MTGDLDGIDAFFTPETVAVIGASRDQDKIGHSVMRNFTESDFAGTVYPVNPNADEVMGRRAVASVSAIEEHVDLGVVAVPAGVANDVIREAIAAGVDALIVITSGYREIGGDGEDRSEELRAMIQDSDTRLIGPNCLGVWDAYSGVDTLFLPSYKMKRPDPGEIAIITQSGSFGSAVMDMLADMEVGVSRFISYGNQADVTETELMRWLQHDDETEAIAIYMEGVSDGERFVEAAKAVTPEMPVITLKGGRHDAGKSAVSSHTGSLAGSYDVYNGVFRQTGVLEATSIEELFDYARALAYNPPMAGDRVAVVTNGGGFGVLGADVLQDRGLRLAEFSEETRDALRDIVPDYGNVGNPLDIIGDASPDRLEAALDAVVADDTVDGVIAMPLLQPLPMESDAVDVLMNVREQTAKPLVACMAGGAFTALHATNLETNEIAAYSSPERAAAAMDALARHGDWCTRHGTCEPE